MNIIAAVISLAFCCFMGFRFSAKYIKREQFFRDVCAFLSQLTGQIGFLKKPLAEIIAESEKAYESAFGDILTKYRKLLISGEAANLESVRQVVKHSLLKKEESELLGRLFEGLGKSDSEYQLMLIEEYKRRFSDLLGGSAEEKKKYSAMYKKLGAILGVGAFIVFI